MAGLLEWANSPAGMGLLSAVAGGMAGARRGQPINSIGRGLVTGVQGYAGAQQQLRSDEENALAKRYKEMQMQQIESTLANQKGMRESLQSLYKPAGTQAFQADNPFGEDLGNLQTETPATFGGKPVDPVMAAVLPYAQPDDILRMTQGADKTAEMRNFEYGQGLPEDQRALFMPKAGGSSPATVQEWEFFSKLDPQAQSQFLEMKRNPQIMNLGGSQAVRAPGGGIGESYAVTPKQTDMPAFQAAQETAKATAKAGVEQGVESTKKGRTADALLSNIQDAETILKQGNASGSLLGKGASSVKGMVGISDATTQANRQLKLISGWMVANVPRMEGPQSNFDVQNYREMAATVGDESIPVKDREAALTQLRTLQEKYKTINSATEPSQSTARRGGTLSQGEILNEELRNAINSGDTRNANLIREEMRRMGLKPGATGNKTKTLTPKAEAYKEYVDAYKRATPEQRKAINARARELGVIR